MFSPLVQQRGTEVQFRRTALRGHGNMVYYVLGCDKQKEREDKITRRAKNCSIRSISTELKRKCPSDLLK